jgi:DNA-directed RNA polymerase subunit RPC12/RpoP
MKPQQTQEAAQFAAAVAILLSCPKCGAPFEVDDEARSLACEHCGSLLLLEAPERDELYVTFGQIGSRDELAEILIDYRVQAQRAEIVHRYRDGDGNPPSELFIQARLAAYERKLRGAVRVLEAREIFVPYWHITGSIVQGILGRVRQDIKVTRVRSFAVEHTVPGYDTERANLRDRGLRMDHMLARPLTSAIVEQKKQFLPRVDVAERPYQEIRKWLVRDLDRRIEPIAKHGQFLFPHRLLVYRPYWIAKLVTDKGPESVLFDGCFRTIAGYPSEPEARALATLNDADPLGAAQAAFRRVLVVASRCPDCGHEQRFDRRAFIGVCANCHLGLELTEKGAAVFPYDHALQGQVDLDADYLPFWRFPLAALLAGGKRVQTLQEYAKALFPQLPPGFTTGGRDVWVPAFRLLGSEPGDASFKGISEWIHSAPLEYRDGKIPIGGKPKPVGVSLSESEARALVPFVLLASFGKTAAARLNMMLVRKAVQDAKFEPTPGRLVMVPFQRNGEDLTVDGTGVRIPPVLMRGGPELLGLRATVIAALAAADAN